MSRILMLVVLTVPWASAQHRPDPVSAEIAGDQFAAGSSVRIQESVTGDLFAAGGYVTIRGDVNGDAVAAGGDVHIESSIKQGGIYAAGGRVMVNAEVARNVRIAGGSVELGPQAIIHGNASLAGGQIDVSGTVDGYVQAGGGTVYLNGPVKGDVHITARELELGPNARIAGRLRYGTQVELKKDAVAWLCNGRDRSGGNHAKTVSTGPHDAAVMASGRSLDWCAAPRFV